MRVRLAAVALFLASAGSGRLWASGHFGFIVQLHGAGRTFVHGIQQDETPAVRIDSVSRQDGRAILLGDGFGETPTVTFDGEPGTALEQSPARLVIQIPDRPFPIGLTVVQVESGGIRSNSVLLSTLR